MAGGRAKFYVVRVGKKIGIYRTWEEADEHVTGYGGAEHQSFATYEEAVEYMSRRSHDDPGSASGSQMRTKAAARGCAGRVRDSEGISRHCQCSVERFLGIACNESSLEVVAYGQIVADELIARTEAAELMMQRVLAATCEKMKTLEAENAEMKQLLGL
ncbi:hypothetical protein PIB30_006349 [Stylosanthes scabra]|uniref:Ribonuclease H1 N-terminal domain-containing protein n=1 Tax=Stylosanthes scabra TaxID=79078 RepID=A0ABU6S3L8_9FABA|nr:hypothetical protein [Stylosanthes scabra]